MSATKKEMPSFESSLDAETAVDMFLAFKAHRFTSPDAPLMVADGPTFKVEWE